MDRYLTWLGGGMGNISLTSYHPSGQRLMGISMDVHLSDDVFLLPKKSDFHSFVARIVITFSPLIAASKI